MAKKKDKKEVDKKENKKKKKTEHKEENLLIKRIVAVFATFFIVIGVAVVGLFARDAAREATEGADVEATSTEMTVSAIMVVKEEGARLHKLDGERIKDLVWPDDTGLLDAPLSQLKGANMMNGENAWLKNGFKVATTTRFRSPDGRREMRLEQARRDGSKPLIISYGPEEDMRILRLRGRVLRDLQLIGWVDSQRIAFMGNVTGTAAIFTVDLGGVLDYIAPVAEGAWEYRVFDEEIYWLMSDVGENDGEKYKAAPGAILRMDLAGNSEELAREIDSVIQSYAINESGIYYEMADQTMVKRDGKKRVFMGSCMPLLALDEGVLCRAGDGIEYRREDMDPVRLFDAKEGGVFYLPEVVIE